MYGADQSSCQAQGEQVVHVWPWEKIVRWKRAFEGQGFLVPGGRHLLYETERKKQNELRPKPLQPKLLVPSSLEGFKALLVVDPQLSTMHFKATESQKELIADPMGTDADGG